MAYYLITLTGWHLIEADSMFPLLGIVWHLVEADSMLPLLGIVCFISIVYPGGWSFVEQTKYNSVFLYCLTDCRLQPSPMNMMKHLSLSLIYSVFWQLTHDIILPRSIYNSTALMIKGVNIMRPFIWGELLTYF